MKLIFINPDGSKLPSQNRKANSKTEFQCCPTAIILTVELVRIRNKLIWTNVMAASASHGTVHWHYRHTWGCVLGTSIGAPMAQMRRRSPVHKRERRHQSPHPRRRPRRPRLASLRSWLRGRPERWRASGSRRSTRKCFGSGADGAPTARRAVRGGRGVGGGSVVAPALQSQSREPSQHSHGTHSHLLRRAGEEVESYEAEARGSSLLRTTTAAAQAPQVPTRPVETGTAAAAAGAHAN
jgi:hypothetical protein